MADTASDLKKEFQTRYPTLQQVAAKFLGLSDERIVKRKFHQGLIPFPVMKMTKSQKAPLLVDLNDFADYLDQQALIAKEVL